MPDLGGFTVGVTADRHQREQSAMLRRFGIDVVIGTSLATLPQVDDGLVAQITDTVIADPPDYLVASTAVGLRNWLSMATTWGIGDELVAALGRARVVARGPKAAVAAQLAGLPVWWVADTEQMAAVAHRLGEEDLRGRRVVVQVDGGGSPGIGMFLSDRGADVVEIQVYRWALPEDLRPLERVIDLCVSGMLDAVTFTTAPALRHFFEVGQLLGSADDMRQAFNSGAVLAACIGPVCAEAAAGQGIRSPAVPEHWRLASLVRLVVEHLADRRRSYSVDGHDMVIQGSAVVVDGEPVRLTDRERAVLDRLVARSGGTVSRSTLLGEVWEGRGVDAHVLETVVARLRAKLGDAGGAVETAVRRGYRFSAVSIAGPPPERTKA